MYITIVRLGYGSYNINIALRMNERFEWIKLDIGCCGLYSRLRDLKIPLLRIWLHNKIKKCTSSVTGMDISK